MIGTSATHCQMANALMILPSQLKNSRRRVVSQPQQPYALRMYVPGTRYQVPGTRTVVLMSAIISYVRKKQKLHPRFWELTTWN